MKLYDSFTFYVQNGDLDFYEYFKIVHVNIKID